MTRRCFVYVKQSKRKEWNGDRCDYPLTYVEKNGEQITESLRQRQERLLRDDFELVRIVVPSDADTTAATELLKRRGDWGDVNLCLLGNVWLTDRAASEMRTHAPELHVYGRLEASLLFGGAASIFGLSWSDKDSGVVAEALEANRLRAESREDAMAASLFPTANYLMGHPLNSWTTSPDLRGVWHEINDYTAIWSSWDFFTSWRMAHENRFVFQEKLVVRNPPKPRDA